MSEKFKPEEFAPPAPPSPGEIGKRIGELIATVLEAPPKVIGAVKDLLDKGANEIRAGPPGAR